MAGKIGREKARAVAVRPILVVPHQDFVQRGAGRAGDVDEDERRHQSGGIELQKLSETVGRPPTGFSSSLQLGESWSVADEQSPVLLIACLQFRERDTGLGRHRVSGMPRRQERLGQNHALTAPSVLDELHDAFVVEPVDILFVEREDAPVTFEQVPPFSAVREAMLVQSFLRLVRPSVE